MTDKIEGITLTQQCALLSISRGSIYYQPEISDHNLELMHAIDEVYTKNPTYGTRRISAALKKRFKLHAGRGKIRSLMRRMGISAIYPKRNLSFSDKQHKKYPYLLRGVPITRVNQVWSTDVTYVRLDGGFIYLTAVIDWYSRYVLAWRVSTTLSGRFCREVLREALERYGKPEIFNTDQGTQYTDKKFIQILKDHDIKISMDGKGRALDNVFVERLWRTVKYEDIYLKGYKSVKECKKGLKDYFEQYNFSREHQSLDYNYPADIYLGYTTLEKAA